jgi:thiamine kinase-like enzyme
VSGAPASVPNISSLTAEQRAADIASRLWSVGEESIESLSGGMTNRNFKVGLPDGTAAVIRIFGERTELLLVDRDIEVAATSIAASLGVAPAVLADLREEGALVVEFVEGAPIPLEEMAKPDTLRRVVDTLHTLHGGPPFPGTIDPLEMAETYYETASGYGVTEQQTTDYLWAHEIGQRVMDAVDFRITSPIHGDLLPGNFIDQGKIRLLDWEYAGMSDPRFDLANMSVNHKFSIDDDRRLVSYYFGEEDERILASIRLLRFMSALRESLWGYVQEYVSKVEFDYKEYNAEYSKRMRASTKEAEFEYWFEVLSR